MTAQLTLRPSKIISISILILAAFILIHPVLAQDSSTSAKNRPEVRKEKMASREAALKARLQAFQDKRKADIATRVNTNLNKINQNQTTQMKNHLDRMSALLDKLEARANQKFPDARASIASASSAVSTQAAKDYSLQVTSETTVKKDAQAVITKLRTDLQATRKIVIDAKQSVANAIRVAKSGTVMREGTSSGQQ